MIVIEHNLDVLKTCDYLIDLGLEGGDGGGYLIAEGTPDQLAEHTTSYTGAYLKKFLPKKRKKLKYLSKARVSRYEPT